MNNRELKFRAFYENKLYMQEYCGGFSYFIHNDSDALTLEDIFVAAERQKCIIQQYTGIKDKNGIPIFEGDLVQYNQNSNYDGINFEVVWSDASFGWVLKSKTGDYLTNQITPNGPRYNFLEVIGNIFENPKLIKTNE
jgi:uncharacterized phage protein (TIGR01671 family)